MRLEGESGAMDLPNHVVVSSEDSSLSSPLQQHQKQKNPPQIHVTHPHVPDCENSADDGDEGRNNLVFTIEEEMTRVTNPFNCRISGDDQPTRNEWVSIPMNGGGCRDDPQYLATPTARSWDKLSLASSVSPTVSYTNHSFDVDQRSSFIYDKIRSLVAVFRQRAQNIKERLMRPSTPSSVSSDDSEMSSSSTAADQQRRYSTITFDSTFQSEAMSADNDGHCDRRMFISSEVVSECCRPRGCLEFFNPLNAVDSQSKFYIVWLFLVSLCYLYNAWSILLRATFDSHSTPENSRLWFTLDCIADVVYLLDLLAFKPRLKVLSDDFWITDIKRTYRIYVQSWNFVLDALSLLPLDLICVFLGYSATTLLRLPRLLKIHTFWEFFERFDHIASFPYIIRIVHTLTYMLFLIHVNACAYYAYSDYEGIGRPDNQWVYDGEGNAYIRCFLFATKIATSIGKNPLPQNEGEYLFMTVSWLSGVFIFAMLIGQIRDILYVASQRRSEYRKVMNRTMVYMKRLNLTKDLRDRTRLWFNFNWDQQKSLDEGRIFKKLPRKMQIDIAMHVHYLVLSKVKLFQDFDRTLLRDIVLRLKPYLYLPGGYVCRKGEVGTEMYIVNDGQVNVIGGENDDFVMAVLGKGSVFGEISLLSTGLGNRRTANVRSRGYSNLFVLSKADLHDAIKDYPIAQETLLRRSRKLFRAAVVSRDNADDDRVSFDSSSVSLPSLPASPSTPKLLRTVLQVVSSNSMTANLICRGSRSWHGFNLNSVPSNPTLFLTDSSLESSVLDLPIDNSICGYSSDDHSVFDVDPGYGDTCQTCFSQPPTFNSYDVEATTVGSAPNVDENVNNESFDSLTHQVECLVTVHRPSTPVP